MHLYLFHFFIRILPLRVLLLPHLYRNHGIQAWNFICAVRWDMDNNVNRRMAYNHYFGAKQPAKKA